MLAWVLNAQTEATGGVPVGEHRIEVRATDRQGGISKQGHYRPEAPVAGKWRAACSGLP